MLVDFSTNNMPYAYNMPFELMKNLAGTPPPFAAMGILVSFPWGGEGVTNHGFPSGPWYRFGPGT